MNDKRRRLHKDISQDVLNAKDMPRNVRKNGINNSSPMGDDSVSPLSRGELKRGFDSSIADESGLTPIPTPSITQGKGIAAGIAQNALKLAAIFALAIGTGTMSADAQEFVLGESANIRGANEIEQNVLEEQEKSRKFLRNRGQKSVAPRSMGVFSVDAKTYTLLQSFGQNKGLIDSVGEGVSIAKNSSPMGEARRGTSGHSEALAEESPNFADYANVQSGVPSHTLRMTENTSSPMGEVARSAEGEWISSQSHPTGISKLTSSLRNSILPVQGGIATGFAETNLSEGEVADINILLPSGEGARSADEGSDSNLLPNGIDPSPENQLFASAQRDFLPSPVGRGLGRGIPTGYAAELDRQVVNSGETRDKIEGQFTNRTITNTPGGFVYNSGTINYIDAYVNNNTHNDTNQASGLIYNGGTIYNIFGTYSNNTINAAATGNVDDGIIISNHVTIDTINATFSNNKMIDTGSDGNPNGVIYSVGIINHIYGSFLNNSVTSAVADSTWGVGGAAILLNGGSVVGDINATFTGNYVNNTGSTIAAGGAIHTGQFDGSSSQTITSISGTFTNNYAQANSGAAKGGAIFNANGGGTSTITSIGTSSNPATFTGNYAKSTSGGAYGGAINNAGTIGNIYGNFIGNKSISDNSYTNGGAIHLDGTSAKITNLEGNFINNSVSSKQEANGSAVFVQLGEITNIKGLFSGNNATSTDSWARSALWNNGTIRTVEADFINNTANGTGVMGAALGLNSGAIIDSVKGDFIGNVSTSTSGAAQGGALYNAGTINTITGNFINNKATSGSTSSGINAQGAGIWNSGTIGHVYGDFVGNVANNTAGYIDSADGGAIYNTGTMTITGSFYNNSTPAVGGAIYNKGTVTLDASDRDILFFNNQSSTEYVSKYYDIGSPNILNFNADSKYDMSFGGLVSSSIININDSSKGSTGGEYVFNNTLSGGTVCV